MRSDPLAHVAGDRLAAIEQQPSLEECKGHQHRQSDRHQQEQHPAASLLYHFSSTAARAASNSLRIALASSPACSEYQGSPSSATSARGRSSIAATSTRSSLSM